MGTGRLVEIRAEPERAGIAAQRHPPGRIGTCHHGCAVIEPVHADAGCAGLELRTTADGHAALSAAADVPAAFVEVRRAFGEDRSEEHTSELQSLMRITYAVFCLKKKTQHHSKSP